MKRDTIAVQHLVPHPMNPRPKTDGHQDLVDSIQEIGLLQPLVVIPENGGRFRVVAGNRRLAAVRDLGWEEVDVVILEGLGEDHGIGAMIADNSTHQPPDPVAEAQAVGFLLDHRSITDAAAMLGKSPKWVAERQALSQVDPELLKRWREGKLLPADRRPLHEDDVVPLASLIELARLTPTVQLQVARDNPWELLSVSETRRIVSDMAMTLASAPWDLDDGELVPTAGPCSACPKSSASTPLLFGDEADVDVKAARCRDATCWGKKRLADVERRVRLEKERTGEELLVIRGEGSHRDRLGIPDDALYLGSWAPAKKAEPGARKAFVVAGKGVGKTRWIRPVSHTGDGAGGRPSRAKKGKDGKPTPPTTEERKKRLAARRGAFVVDTFREDRLENLDVPPVPVVANLIAAYGIERGHNDDIPSSWTPWTTRRRKLGLYAGDGDKSAPWAKALWPAVRRAIQATLVRGSADPSPQLSAVKVLAELLGVDLVALEALAEEKIPTPKVLLKAPPAAKKKASKAAPAKGKKVAKKKKVTKKKAKAAPARRGAKKKASKKKGGAS